MAKSEVVIDGDLHRIDGEFGAYIRAGEESPIDELYGTWTDIVGKYAGRDLEQGTARLTTGKDLNQNGEVVSGLQAVCETYIPVDPNYIYVKSNHRFTKLTCYDSNKVMISQDTSSRYDKSVWGTELVLPQNASYIRFCTNYVTDNWRICIFRTK